MKWSDLKADEASRIAVLGGHLEQSLLPDILRAGLGSEWRVVPLEVDPAEFEQAVEHLQAVGFRGAAVAHPHKVAAARLGARFFAVRTAMGVANTLSFESDRVAASNTEAPAIQSLLESLEPATALIMGAGSGARSVTAGLLESGWRVRIWARNGMRARLLRTTFARFEEQIELSARPDPAGCSLVVNATPLGVRAGEKPPVDWNYARRGTTLMDLVYRRVPTEFLREGTMRGFRGIDGRELVVEKTALSIEWWLGQPCERAAMRAAAGLKG